MRTDRRCGWRRAFTLVELMVVVVILGLLSTMVVVNYTKYLSRSKREKARTDVARLRDAVVLFYTSTSRYPTNEEGLLVLTARTDADEPVLASLPPDPWGQAYLYVSPGQRSAFEIVSLGRDGRRGGDGEDADLSSDTLTDPQDQPTP